MKTLREEIESIKFKCPDCVLPHNLSSLEIDKILKVIAKRDEECVGCTGVYIETKEYNSTKAEIAEQLKSSLG